MNVAHKSLMKCPHKNCDSYITRYNLPRHIRSLHDNVKKTCENCGKQVTNLKIHFERCPSDGEREFHCLFGDCKAAFTTKMYLSNHAKRVHLLPTKCPREDCDAYIQPINLSLHMKRVHGRANQRCKNCWKEFSDLRRHSERCAGDGVKKFHCRMKNCQSVFVTKQDLTRHVNRTHATRVKCPHNDCDSYIEPAGIGAHVKLVHQKILKTCANCGKEMLFSSLRPHLERCSGDETKSHHCRVRKCEASFTTKADLNSHVCTVHKEPVKCPHGNCNAVLKPYLLAKHKRLVHDKVKNILKSCLYNKLTR